VRIDNFSRRGVVKRKMSHGEGPLVTAVVTTFDRPAMAKRAVQSVLAQTYRPIEIIVVEDGSESGIDRWLKGGSLTCIQYMRHEDNKGLAASRNTGLRSAQGKYVAYLDDDDEWLPEKLAKQVRLFETKGEFCAVVYCGATILSPQGEMIGENRPRLNGDIRTAIRESGLLTIPSSCLFLKAALEQVAGYDETLCSHVDHDIWLRLARQGYAAGYVDDCLVKIHQHHEQKMTDDAPSRVQATRLFCSKWEDYLETWFGRWETQRYCSRFKGRVMAMLGWAFLGKGKRGQGVKYFLLALRYDWKKRNYYEGLAASIIGSGLWANFLKTWKRFKHSKA